MTSRIVEHRKLAGAVGLVVGAINLGSSPFPVSCSESPTHCLQEC